MEVFSHSVCNKTVIRSQFFWKEGGFKNEVSTVEVFNRQYCEFNYFQQSMLLFKQFPTANAYVSTKQYLTPSDF